RALDGFYRFFERFERITKKSFFDLQAPMARRPIPPNEPAAEFVAEVVGLWENFLEHMDDDFNTGGAIGVLFELLTALNRFADAEHLEDGQATEADLRAFQRGVLILKELSQILGIFHKPAAVKEVGNDKLLGGVIQLLIDLRADARKNKNFALGDQIRKRLGELGVALEDRSGGTIWRIE